MELFKLYLNILLNSIRYTEIKDKIRILFFIFLGVIFLIIVYYVSYEVILYIINLPIIGNSFMFRILGFVLLTSFVMLIFSSLTVSLSTMYNAFDIEFLLSLPVDFKSIFLTKFILNIIRSSWMILVVVLPFITAFSLIKNINISKYVLIIFAILIKLIIACSLGSFLSIVLSYLAPSKKVKNYTLVFLILMTSIGYSLLRVLQPEKILSFESFPELMNYLDFLSKPVGKLFPSWWVCEIIYGFTFNNFSIVLKNFIKLFLILILFFSIIFKLGKLLYFNGLFKTESYKFKKIEKIDIFRKHKSLFSVLVAKELKIFTREPIQWVQLIVVAALILVYIFNITKLPLTTEIVRFSVCFLNIGAISFVLAALVLRFLFIQPSLEYNTFWLIKSSPLELKKFFIAKFLVYVPFIIFPAFVLSFISNFILKVDSFMFIFTSVICLINAIVLSLVGYFLGILFPKKNYKDIAEIETSFGGLVFIVSSLCYIVVCLCILAGIVKRYLMFSNLSNIETIYRLFLFVSINFISIFSLLYYAKKKVMNEY